MSHECAHPFMHFVCCVVVVVNMVIPHLKYQEVVLSLSVASSSMFLRVHGSCHMSAHTNVHKMGENRLSSQNTWVVLTYF
jgi:hypothetical protein